MEPVAGRSVDFVDPYGRTDTLDETLATSRDKKDRGGIFTCSFCALEERYDYKGAKPPFARLLRYTEDCYVLKDPFSMVNKGEVLVLGADCSSCSKPVCLGCCLFFVKRYCKSCALERISTLPGQLHPKIRNLNTVADDAV